MTDADQFEAFVREFQDMVYATAVRLLGNPAEAEDVAQTVFLKAFERFGAVGPGPAAAGWLKTVATNACLNHLSRTGPAGAFSASWAATATEGHEPSNFADTLASDSSPTVDFERADLQGRLERRWPAAGPSARAARALSFRRNELRRHRRDAARLTRQGQDRHSQRPRGSSPRSIP